MKTILIGSYVAVSFIHAGLPALAATTCKVVPTTFKQLIASPGGTMAVVTDRPETIPAFFRRNHVVAGQLVQVDPLNVQQRTKVSLKEPSNNFQGEHQAKYSTVLDLAPASTAFRNAKFPQSNTILLIQDASDPHLFHPAGYMTYPSAQFFAAAVALPAEKLTSQDLIYGSRQR